MICEYQDKDGNWTPTDMRVGYRHGFYYYQWQHSGDQSMTFEPKDVNEFALSAVFQVSGPQMDRRRTLHRSLPSPLHVRFTLQEINGGSMVFQVTAERDLKELSLATRESELAKYENDATHVLCGFLSCDDLEAEGRVHATIWRVDDGREINWKIMYSQSNSYCWYSVSALKRRAWEAAQANASTIRLEGSCEASNGFSLESNALVDVERRAVYALQLKLTTHTGTAEGTFLLEPRQA